MNLDVSALKRALFDLVKFNPKDFNIQGSPTGYLIGLNKQGSSTSVPVAPGSIVDTLPVAFCIVSNVVTAAASNYDTAADALTAVDALKAGVDSDVTTSFNTNYGTINFQKAGYVYSDSSNFFLPVSFKRTRLTRYITFSGGLTKYTAEIEEQRVLNFLVVHNLASVTASVVNQRVTVINSGSPSTSTLSTNSIGYTAVPVNIAVVPGQTDIAANSWPTNPSDPGAPGSKTSSIELRSRITI